MRPPIPCETTESQTVSAFLEQDDVEFDSISYWYVWDSVGREYRLNVASWRKRLVSKLRYKLSLPEPQPRAEKPQAATPQHVAPELTNAMTKAQVLDALKALIRGEEVSQRVLVYLAAEQFIVVDDVTNMDTPRGQKEYLFISFAEKGQRLFDWARGDK